MSDYVVLRCAEHGWHAVDQDGPVERHDRGLTMSAQLQERLACRERTALDIWSAGVSQVVSTLDNRT
jgi:hypothetical protein